MREIEHLKKISDYMKRNLSKGYDEDSLKWALMNQGHSRASVEKAIDMARQELAKETIPKEKPIITHEIITDEPAQLKRSWWKGFFGLE